MYSHELYVLREHIELARRQMARQGGAPRDSQRG
jgi:hypothetical protein